MQTIGSKADQSQEDHLNRKAHQMIKELNFGSMASRDVEVATKGGPMVRGGQYIEIPLQKVAVRLPHIIVRTAPQRMYVERSRAATLLV